MPSLSQNAVRNRLLMSMDAASFGRLAPHLEAVELPLRALLVAPDIETEQVYFLESGIASIVARSRDDREETEVGHIGRDGVTGAHLVLGTSVTPNRTFIQVEGTAFCLAAPILTEAVEEDPALRRLLLRYIHAYEIQLSQSALANSRYSIKERLARWLLMCRDRVDDDDIPLTHEFLSLMLGVRRSGVTDEIHIMEGLGIIRATRGHVRVLDRAQMEEIAAGCYGLPEREYERLIGPPRASEA